MPSECCAQAKVFAKRCAVSPCNAAGATRVVNGQLVRRWDKKVVSGEDECFV